MVDLATLPKVSPGDVIGTGQQFVITGYGFDAWPSDVVLGFSLSDIQSNALAGSNMLKLISKTNTEMLFEAVDGHTYSIVHEWTFFGDGFNPPREVLEYDGR